MRPIGFSVLLAVCLGGCEVPAGDSSVKLGEASYEDALGEMSNDTFFYDLTVPNSVLESAGGVDVMATEAGVAISGGDPDVGVGGKISAARLTLDSDKEAYLSGKNVKVSVLSKSDSGASLKLAYSTRDVGNSGWRLVELSSKYQVHSIEYSVPLMRKGRGDFVGFLPVGGDVSLAAISVHVAGVE